MANDIKRTIIYIVTHNSYDYSNSWSSPVKAFFSKKDAELFIQDLVEKSKIMRDKIAHLKDSHAKICEPFYVKLRNKELQPVENEMFRQLNQDHFDQIENVRCECDMDFWIEDTEEENFTIDELELISPGSSTV